MLYIGFGLSIDKKFQRCEKKLKQKYVTYRKYRFFKDKKPS